MQHGQGFDQPYFFMTAPTDVFGYPLAAPAAGPAFTDQRYVWDADSAMAGIDMDFATAGHAIFQSPAIGHRPMDSLDWAKIANLIFQESPAKREGETASADQGVFADAFSPPMPNIFGPVDWPVGCEGAVDPGLLFRQPPSLASEAIASRLENPVPPPGCSTPPEVDANSPDTPGPLVSRASMPSGVRRSAASVREIRPRWPTGQGSGSAPVKPAGGPVRSRSSSGSRGRKALPPLAPAPRPRNQDAVLCTLATRKATRATPEKPSRSVRVSSPLKCHHRLSSLSIPEASSPQMRTRAKFSIDADGRARVETTLIVEQDGVCAIRKKAVDQPMARQRHCEDEDESSSDEEPIIIPSRNTSFALPSLDKGPNKHTLRQLQRSFSGRHTSDLLVTLPGRSLDETDSEAETAMYNDVTPTSRARGDAARELRKMRDGRQQQDWAASAVSSSERRVYPAQHIPWPTRQSGTCLPTASTASRSSRVRCVCHSPQLDKPHGDVFMVQWCVGSRATTNWSKSLSSHPRCAADLRREQ